MNPASAAHAADTLRTLDRERYFATLILPPAARSSIQALYAFSAEVATVRDRVSSPAPGEIRLQWWRDALTGEGHGMVRQNPLADALLDAIEANTLPVAPLVALLDARRFDLYQDPMPDLPTFEGYAGETVSVLYQLGAIVLNHGTPVATGDAAGHLGVAQALVGHLRAFGYNASRARIFLPMSIFAANGVSEAEILSGTVTPGLLGALGQIADLAGEHLAKARRAVADLPPPLRPAFATVALLPAQLARLAPFRHPFGPGPDIADWQKIARLAWSNWRQH